MNVRIPSRRRRGALAVSLALSGMVAVPPSAFGTPLDCTAQNAGCGVRIAQASGMPPEPMPMPMPMPQQMPMPMPGQQTESSREGSKSRGAFLAMFAQAAIPALVSGIDGWLRNRLNVPMQGGPGDPMQGGNMVAGLRAPEMQGMQGMPGMPGMQPQPGPGNWSPPGQMPMPQGQGQWSGNSFPPPMSPMNQQMNPQMNQAMNPQWNPPMNQQMSPQMNPPMPSPGMAQMPGQPSMQGMPSMQGQTSMPPPLGMNDDSSALQAGVAYQVSLVGRDGIRTLVDPSQRAFDTGERISVAYRTNLPGIVEVYNIDSTGREELIDQQQMSAGQLANLGPYEFVNVKGEETLRIVLRPCVGGSANSATRGMVRAQVTPELGNKLVDCEDPAVRQQQRSSTRGIAKVQLDGGTNYALDPVSRSELESGRLAPREVRVRFFHR